MRTAKVGLILAAALACGRAGTPTGGTPVPPPPQVLLHIPFDGTLDIAFAADGRTAPSYLYAAYRPGVKAQGAELGSDRYPSGLVIPCRGLLDKAKGSIEFWYMPVWNPGDQKAQEATRTLVTDEKPSGAVGHFWLGIERGSLVFGWQGERAVGVAAPIRRWKPETWRHVVATWDSSSAIRLFLDGEQAGELALTWRLPPSDLLYIGADRYGAQRSDGLFDEFRLYDRALTPTEVELAFIRNLAAKNAPARPNVTDGTPVPPKAPRLSLHAPFDNLAEAQTAAGSPRPLVAEATQFGTGLLGQALAATTGLKLAYNLDKNLSKDAGAFTVWARSLPERRALQRVLLGDDFFAAGPAQHAPGSFALWLYRDGANHCAFGLWPLRIEEKLDRWDEGDWYHFAASWRRGDRVTFYVNGREVGRASARQAAWAAEAPKQLRVGSLDGRSPADALLDDLRVYDAPLSPEEVQKQASQFLLPLVMVLDRTLHESGRVPIAGNGRGELAARFYNTSPEQVQARLTLQVLNPEGKEVHSVQGPLEVAPHAWASFRLPLTAEHLASPGLYEVTTSCAGRVSCPRAHLLVVDPKTGAAGPDATARKRGTHVETIECAKRSTPDAFCESGGARIVRGSLGDYREAGAYPDARFAYRFRVERTGVPHVAVVSYPADRVRSAEIIITSRRYPASQDVATGYLVEEPDAADPRLVELPIYFWPRERENALVFRTLLAGRPAACASVVVREAELAAGPPAAGRPEERRRTIGVHWDDPAVPLQFGATGTAPPEVYESFRRLVDCAAAAGQNLLSYPVAWRWGTLYPVEGEDFRPGAGAQHHCTDWIEYVLYLCERRGIQFLPEIVFDDMAALSKAFGGDDAESVVAGRKSARMVLWDDTLSPGGPGGPPRYNPLHPAVRDALLERVSEVVERYGKSPALAGVSVRLGPGQSAWFGSIQAGYDDETFDQFLREAGVEAPGGMAGPTRFSERARWLLANKCDQWVNFRCRRLRQFYVDLASRVQSKRPALKLYLTVGLPDALSGFPLLNLTAWANRTATLDVLYREAGLDTSLLKDRPANLVIRRVAHPTDDKYLAYRFDSGGPNPHPAAARDLAFLSEGCAPLIGLPRTAVACSCRPLESSIGALRPVPGFWWQEHPARASHPAPAGRRFLEPYAHAVAEMDALSITAGGSSLATLGHEAHVAEFARAFCALPQEPFLTVLGMSDPACIRELHTGAGHVFYLVNRASFPVDVSLAFSDKAVKLRDLAEGKEVDLPRVKDQRLPAALPKDFVSEHALPDDEGPLPEEPTATQLVTGALLQVKLAPYELRSYRTLTAGAAIHYAACAVPESARSRLAQRLESAKSLVANSTASAEVVATARATLDLIARAWRKQELTRVGYLLDSYPLARLR
ncbi:MAG: hypothetical protein FJ290_15955 [Planctomycetes bacterium]|nr:hypothetical protein [Planctomycetota bacterium]